MFIIKCNFLGAPRFVISNRGTPVIVLDCYRFNKWSGSKGPKIRWTCNKKQQGCRASITTIDNEVIRINNFHTHD